MNEQTFLLCALIVALSATLGLYLLKARNQMRYRGDERWHLVELRAAQTANLSNTLLLVVLIVCPLFVSRATTFTLQRVTLFGLLFIGARNAIELIASLYWDRRL